MTETNRIEFKRELTRELDIEREVVAFLNYHEGGMLYIGIDDSGKPIGVQDIDGDILNNEENFVFMDNFIRVVIPYAWLPSNSEDGEVNVPVNVLENVLENSEKNLIQLTERQIHIIFRLKETGKMNVLENVLENEKESSASLAEYFGVNERTIRRDLQFLQRQGHIRHIGPDKGGHWELIEKE